MAFLIDLEDIDEVFDLQKYKPHRLSGDRAGTFSFHVTPNWRITFRHDAKENELYDVDYEDYH
jgi:proteic killer suppression protein